MAGELWVPAVGNLTADPELRYTQNGLPVATFTIAQTEKVWDRASGGTKDGDSIFLRCTVWREFAEHVAGSFTKGMRVIAYGKLKQRSYQDRDGNQRTSIELDVEAVGPDLRYATAVVTRAAAQNGGTDWDAVNRQRGQVAPPPQHQAPVNDWTTAPPGGSFGDDTPF